MDTEPLTCEECPMEDCVECDGYTCTDCNNNWIWNGNACAPAGAIDYCAIVSTVSGDLC